MIIRVIDITKIKINDKENIESGDILTFSIRLTKDVDIT